MTIFKKGKEWQILKVYPNFYLCRNDLGYKECFSKFEIDGVPRQLIYKSEQVYYIENKPYTIKQIMSLFNLTRSQVTYRIQSQKELPNGKVIQRIDMQ